MTRSTLSQRIYQRHIKLVREVRDMYIFVQQAIGALEAAKTRFNGADRRGGKDKRYYVPASGRTKFAQRKDAELIAIYERYSTHGLYETFLISGVAVFESFLGEILRYVFEEYPKSITRKYPDIAACTAIPVDVVLDGTTKDQIVRELIDRHVASVFYARPHVYVGYVCELTGADRDDPAFADYIEIKATRDLLVHGDASINQIYLDKAKDKARGSIGDTARVDCTYFDHYIRTVTRISGIFERDSNYKFPAREKPHST